VLVLVLVVVLVLVLVPVLVLVLVPVLVPVRVLVALPVLVAPAVSDASPASSLCATPRTTIRDGVWSSHACTIKHARTQQVGHLGAASCRAAFPSTTREPGSSQTRTPGTF
jgi:hypothetical protein